jgi:large repetitive protein
MYQWQPSKWLQLAAVGAGLPFLAAGIIQTNGLVQDVSARAMAAAAGPSVTFDGRDAVVSGEVASQDALDALKTNVGATYGVRLVDVSNVKVTPPAPVTLMAPTVESITTAEAMPMIKGTWPEGAAKTLEVTAAGKTYVLGKDAELSSAAGNWTLKPSTALAAGAYDVTVAVSDGDKATASTAAPGKVVIEAAKAAEPPKPAELVAPTIMAVTTNNAQPEIKGTYPVDAAKLFVNLGPTTYELGKSPELTADKAGNWTLKPAAALADGQIDATVKVESADGAVTAASAATPIVVDTVAPAAPVFTKPTADAVWPYAITGKWEEAQGSTLALDFNQKSYVLGKEKELISDGHGLFTFVPTDTLAPGKYDLGVTVTDAVGNVTKAVEAAAVVVAEPAPPPAPEPVAIALAAPTVDSVKSDKAMATVTGTWQAGVAKSLSVTLADKTYQLGKDFDLLSNAGGKWTLNSKAELKNGVYDVVASVTDGADKSVSDATKDELTIDVPAPPPPPAPVVLTAPTIDTAKSEKAMATVTGTWQAGVAKSLSVTLADKTYQLGKDFDLLSNASGKWTLNAKTELKNGVYDVVATVTDGASQSVSDATKDELTIDVSAPPPPPPKPAPAAVVLAAPTVISGTSDSDHPVVKGTWAAGVAKSLVVELDGVKHRLGKDFDLLSNAAGNWTLKPAKPVVNGTYDVIATVTDGADQSVSDSTKNELTVNVAPPPPAPATGTYDCEGTLARIAAVFPVRFDTAKWDLVSPFDSAANQYVALLKDPRCATMKVVVTGHADERGSMAYNMGLSENRAKTVIDALVKAGVDGGRMSAVGMGKTKPLDPSHTADALRKNRRVEFTVAK